MLIQLVIKDESHSIVQVSSCSISSIWYNKVSLDLNISIIVDIQGGGIVTIYKVSVPLLMVIKQAVTLDSIQGVQLSLIGIPVIVQGCVFQSIYLISCCLIRQDLVPVVEYIIITVIWLLLVYLVSLILGLLQLVIPQLLRCQFIHEEELLSGWLGQSLLLLLIWLVL